jgi:hypothetical protein
MTDEKFIPNANQIRLLERARKLRYNCTDIVLCKGIVARNTFYRYLRKSAFAEWWAGEAQSYFARYLPEVYASMYEAATQPVRGTADRRLFLKRFDKHFQPGARVEVDATPGLLASLESMAKRANKDKGK